MDIKENWDKIRDHFKRSFRSNFHVSIASVNEQNMPTVTPIGSLFLNRDQTGFYFEKYPSKLAQHAKNNVNICVLGVNSSTSFWLIGLFNKKFNTFPGLKLYGELGEKREASEKEISRLHKRMRMTRALKGNSYLWGDMKMLRELHFTSVEKINLGEMTQDL